jgi:hypothetical protein
LDAVVPATLKAYPLVSERELRIFLNGRAKAVQSITSYLLAHMSFLETAQAEAAASLATNTLAFHLADPATKEQLKSLFQGIAASIATNAATEELRSIIRKSPLAPASVAHIKTWLTTNRATLSLAARTGGLLEAVYAVVSAELVANSALRSLSDPSVIPQLLSLWCAGAPFSAMHSLLAVNNIRVSGDRVTVEDVVTMSESAFGYDFAMVIATMADLSEGDAPDLSKALGRLQKQIKYGLATDSSITFYESGFADRVVAQALGAVLPTLTYRAAVSHALAQAETTVRAVLSSFPSYYLSVLEERRLVP